jgi:RNA polymerase sigma-70 factor (ECF subfamily)
MPTETMIGIEALLGQERWVRRLAGALVHDHDDAEDVIQEARVASWRRPPRDPERARSWLSTVVRNLVRNRRRAEGTRQRLEAELEAGAEPVPSAERLAERLEIHRALAEAVSRLAEPFRQVVLLRYYEDLSAAEIARRLGEPAGTIRWRLKAGLDRLRADLDERRGSRAAWLVALAPLADGEERPAPASLRPRLLWSATMVLTAGMMVGLGTVMIARHRGRTAALETTTAGRDRAGRRPSRLGAGAALVLSGSVSPAADEVPAWIQLEGAPRRTIGGRVVANGRAVAGANVRLSSGTLTAARNLDRHAVTSGDGTFVFPALPITDWFLTIWSAGLEPVIQYLDLRQLTGTSTVGGHPVDALVIELGPCRVFARGSVRDAGGGAVVSARVRVGAGGPGTETVTDVAGSYELCIPATSVHARVLTAEASGYGAIEARSPAEGGTVDFVLEPQAVVAGRAIDTGGAAAAGVDLMLHPLTQPEAGRPAGERRAAARREARTDERGRFELTGVAPGRYRLRFASDSLFGDAAAVLALGPGEQRRDIEVELSAVAVVDGVVSRQGEPASQADLSFRPVPGPAPSPGPRRTRSDEQGRFRIRVPRDMPLVIETPADPGWPGGRWIPALSSAFVAGRPRREGVRVELPQVPEAASPFVTPPGGVPPPPARALEGTFGDQIRLLGYDASSDHVGRGGQLAVTLHFQALASLEGVRAFSHLVGPGGFTNVDHTPAEGAHPVARWRAGETIRDRFSIAIPATFAPGAYTLLIGFWRPAANHRLPVSPSERDDGQRRFRVLTFTVE